MEKIFSITSNGLDETNIIAERFVKAVKETGAFVCLHGDIGAGKTAFTKLAASHLNVKEKVTSPSFVIINEYLSGDLPVYHFDLYRLEQEGVKTIIDELAVY
jgi:tRNA threonylcarbamoyladenosine biosynthesis protein TsaE